MRIDGRWHPCDDGGVRPVIWGEIQTSSNSWVKAPFLVDTGADRTVFNLDVVRLLRFAAIEDPDKLCGIGGTVTSVIVQTQIRFTNDENGKATFNGQFAAIMNAESLDMSVLGRDILDLFAVLVDRPGDLVTMFGQQHFCTIAKR
jgi:predicted aspartyl protease